MAAWPEASRLARALDLVLLLKTAAIARTVMLVAALAGLVEFSVEGFQSGEIPGGGRFEGFLADIAEQGRILHPEGFVTGTIRRHEKVGGLREREGAGLWSCQSFSVFCALCPT